MKKLLIITPLAVMLVAAAVTGQEREAAQAALKWAQQSMFERAAKSAVTVALEQQTALHLRQRAQARQALADAMEAQSSGCAGVQMVPMQSQACAGSPIQSSSCSGTQTMMVPVQIPARGTGCSGGYGRSPRNWTPIRNLIRGSGFRGCR